MTKNNSDRKNALNKIAIFPLVLALTLTMAFSQKSLQASEVAPQYKGGSTEMEKFIDLNLRYPMEAVKNGIQGVIIVEFIVTKQGKLKHVEANKISIDGKEKPIKNLKNKTLVTLLSNEAVRMVKSMPDWNAGEKMGEKVEREYLLSVPFILAKEGDITESSVKVVGYGVNNKKGE